MWAAEAMTAPAGSPHQCCYFQLAPAEFHYWPGAVLVTAFEIPKSLMKECPGMVLPSDPELDKFLQGTFEKRHIDLNLHAKPTICSLSHY